MTPLHQAVQDYLALRRSLGFKLRCTGALLFKFAAFAESRGAEYVTISLALEWATQSPHQQPATWAGRIKAVRVFARFQHAIDPRTEVPPFGLLPYRPPRLRPYFYTHEEIRRLLEATARLSSRRGIRPHSYHCLLGLLAVSEREPPYHRLLSRHFSSIPRVYSSTKAPSTLSAHLGRLRCAVDRGLSRSL